MRHRSSSDAPDKLDAHEEGRRIALPAMSDVRGMHEGEITVSDEVVRGLVDQQFPWWSSAALKRLPPLGTDNQLFRLGNDLLVRMPRIDWAAASAEWEYQCASSP